VHNNHNILIVIIKYMIIKEVFLGENQRMREEGEGDGE
jgi:hypothetical protein